MSGPDTETKATHWPDGEYRAWVQSQIASKMLVKLGGLTAASVLAAVFWLGNLIENERESAVEELRAEFSTQIQGSVAQALSDELPGQVALQLVQQSNLVKLAEEELRDQWPDTVTALVARDEFIDTASEAIFSTLEDRAASQKLIMDEAASTMGNVSSSPATRALSVEIFALFHPGVRSVRREDTLPLRHVFHEVLEAGVDEPGGLPEQVLYTILDNYPIGPATAQEEQSGDCALEGQTCEDFDSDVIALVLDRMRTVELLQEDQARVLGFFRRTPQRLVGRTLNWDGYDENPALRQAVLAALLTAEDLAARSHAVELLSLALEGDQGSPEFATAAQTLARLDPNRALLRPVRNRVLRRVWAALGDDVANGMFNLLSWEEVREASERFSQARAGELGLAGLSAEESLFADPFVPSLSGDFGISRSLFGDGIVDIPASAHLRAAVLALLRPGSRDQHSGGVEEWDITFEGTIGLEQRSAGILAMARATQRDADRGLDVSAVADRLLDAARQSNGSNQQLLALAIRHAGGDQFATLIEQNYREFWQELGATTIANDISQASFDRLMADGRAGPWLSVQLLGSEAVGERYAEHLVRTVSRTIESRLDGRQFDGVPLERALRAVQAALLDEGLDAGSLVDPLLRHALQVSQSQDGFWPVAEAIENARILTTEAVEEASTTDVLDLLRAQYPWIGRPFDQGVALLNLDRSDRLRLMEPAQQGVSDSQWFGLSVPFAMPIRLEQITSGHVVIFDQSRRRVINRTRHAGRSQQLFAMLQPGEYAVHWRARSGGSDRLAVSVDQTFLEPSEQVLPHEVAPGFYSFLSGPSGGEVWLRVAVEEGQALTVETSSMASSDMDIGSGIEFNVDTVISYFGANGASFLDRDDDGGDFQFSQLTHRATEDGDILVQIYQYFDEPFDRDVAFFIAVRVLD